ncbi:hypothetical protein AAG570_004805 [Ranatra chinensis]|uniref:Uncharacterized protein n=1 Tax=Ranatra chinensis TaxID=642074 RepID=A0ABD0Y3B2_9HEMI
MVSKCRNVFGKDTKQETTEIGVRNLLPLCEKWEVYQVLGKARDLVQCGRADGGSADLAGRNLELQQQAGQPAVISTAGSADQSPNPSRRPLSHQGFFRAPTSSPWCPFFPELCAVAFLKSIVTGDETWMSHYIHENKRRLDAVFNLLE